MIIQLVDADKLSFLQLFDILIQYKPDSAYQLNDDGTVSKILDDWRESLET